MEKLPALLPDTDASWRLWEQNGGDTLRAVGERLGQAELARVRQAVRIGLPAPLCRTVGLSLPESGEVAVQDLVLPQLEKRGLAPRGVASFRTTRVGVEGGRQLIGVDVLSADLPEAVCLESAQDYGPALRYFQFPENAVVLTRQFGRLVFAVGRNGQLLHSHCLGAGSVPLDEIAVDVTAAIHSLEAQGLIERVDEIVLWEDFPSPGIEALEKATGLPCRTDSEILPRSSRAPRPTGADRDSSTALLPAAVEQAKRARRRRQMFLRIAVVALLLYALGIAAFLVLAQRAADRRETLQAQYARTAPEAQEVKDNAALWRDLAPITDYRRFPMFVLGEVTRIMPPGGIVIEEFRADGDTIKIEGAARDAQAAFRLLEDIKATPSLKVRTWEMGQPRMNKNNTAEFEIVGKVEN